MGKKEKLGRLDARGIRKDRMHKTAEHAEKGKIAGGKEGKRERKDGGKRVARGHTQLHIPETIGKYYPNLKTGRRNPA